MIRGQRAWIVAAMALVIYLSPAASQSICVNPQVLLEDVNVVDVVKGSVIAHQDVVIGDGQMVFIGPTDQISRAGIPLRVYAGDKYLIPGLWDFQVELGSLHNLELFVVYGVTEVRDVSGCSPIARTKGSVDRGSEALFPTVIEQQQPNNSRAAAIRFPGCLMLSKLRRDLSLDAGNYVLNPALAMVGEGVRDSWKQEALGLKTPDSQALAERSSRYAQAEQETAERVRKGLPVLAGTDTGEPYTVPGDELHHELELLAKAGLSPAAALQAATISPATAMHMNSWLGTVEVGKQADLVLLGANPLSDIRNTRSIEAVLLKGRYIDRRELDRIIAAKISQ